MLDVVKHYEDAGVLRRINGLQPIDAVTSEITGGAGVMGMPSRAAMVTIKRPEEVARMRHAGLILVDVLDALQAALAPGVTTAELDAIADDIIARAGAVPSFKGYGSNPPFPASICASINDEVVHGIPSPHRRIREGDVVSLDVGCIWQGWHADCARTWFVGTPPSAVAELIDATRRGMEAGIAAAMPGNRLGDVGAAIEAVANEHGYGIVRPFVGHGIGQSMHEDPQVAELRPARHRACGSKRACASPSSRCSTWVATRWRCWTMAGRW